MTELKRWLWAILYSFGITGVPFFYAMLARFFPVIGELLTRSTGITPNASLQEMLFRFALMFILGTMVIRLFLGGAEQ